MRLPELFPGGLSPLETILPILSSGNLSVFRVSANPVASEALIAGQAARVGGKVRLLWRRSRHPEHTPSGKFLPYL